MLTQSHQELETIVTNKEKGMKEQMDITDNNYQKFIQEIQLKDLQIKSLEKLLAQYQNNNNNINQETEEGVTDLNNNNNNYNNNFNDNESIVSFAKDDYKEMQLNKMKNNFDVINNKLNNNDDKENENKNYSGNMNNLNNIGLNQNNPNINQMGNLLWNNKSDMLLIFT